MWFGHDLGRYFYEETDLEHIIIAEGMKYKVFYLSRGPILTKSIIHLTLLNFLDDMTLDTVQYWLHNWEYYFSRIPSDFDVVQLIAPNTFTARRVAEKYK